MKRLFLIALVAAAMGDDCDPEPRDGDVGMRCFTNHTCNKDFICVQWKQRDGKPGNVCADPRDLNVGGFLMPKPCEECPPPPACEPGWKRKP